MAITPYHCTSLIPHQAVQNEFYDPMFFYGTPMAYQAKPDPLLEVVNAIESGAARAFWDDQLITPSETIVGNFTDYLLKKGKYHPACKKTDHFGTEYLCKIGSLGVVVYNDLITGPNSSKKGDCCVIEDPRKYEVSVYGAKGEQVPQGLYCRVQKCIYSIIRSCAPYCTPCEDDTACEKSDHEASRADNRTTMGSKIFNVKWYINVASHGITQVKSCAFSQINKLFEKVIYGCEACEYSKYMDEDRSPPPGLVDLLKHKWRELFNFTFG